MRKLVLAFCVAGGPALATGIEIDVAGQTEGTIVIDLYEDVAPQHADRITGLAERDAYDDVAFHRVIDGFMAQTGDVQHGRVDGDMARAGFGGSDLPDLEEEFSDRPFERGTVGMARSGNSVDSANSQFFIMFAPAPHLNGQYTVVGEVTSGMEVLDAVKRGAPRSGRVEGQPDYMSEVRVTGPEPAAEGG